MPHPLQTAQREPRRLFHMLEQQEALEATERLSKQAVQAEHGGGPALTDTLARWVAARYAVAARRVAETEGPEGWRMLREMCGDVVELRRGDHSAQRLDLESKRASVAKEDAQVRWRRKLIYGLETLKEAPGKIRKRQPPMKSLRR